jgi:hypothetical protein
MGLLQIITDNKLNLSSTEVEGDPYYRVRKRIYKFLHENPKVCCFVLKPGNVHNEETNKSLLLQIQTMLSNLGIAEVLPSGNMLVVVSQKYDCDLITFHATKIFAMQIQTSFSSDNSKDIIDTIKDL